MFNEVDAKKLQYIENVENYLGIISKCSVHLIFLISKSKIYIFYNGDRIV